MSATSRNISPFTFQTQQYNWSGQAWMGSVECPPMIRADAEEIVGFLLAAQRGTFYFQDYANPSPRGAVTGTLTVNTATANTTTLTMINTNGSGLFAVGDWLQISTSLYKVIKVDAGGLIVDVFPVLRKSYAGTTPITKTNAKGVFRLADPKTDWSIELAGIYGIAFGIVEDVET